MSQVVQDRYAFSGVEDVSEFVRFCLDSFKVDMLRSR
jgi:hypothetical protein